MQEFFLFITSKIYLLLKIMQLIARINFKL